MRRRALALFVGTKLATAGGLALLNRALRLDDLPPTLEGRTHDWAWRRGRIRYTTLGDGPPVVLVHGVHAAASSFEWRAQFEPLSRDFAVYALDLLGFGKSERPALHYSGELYAELLGDFLREVVGRPAGVVASSLSAAYAVACAVEQPELVERLVLTCPTGEAGITRSGLLSEAAYRLLRAPIQGEALFNALVSRAGIRRELERNVYADPSRATEAVVEQHYATAHQPNARFAPAAFLGRRLNLPLGPRFGRVRQPALLVWGREATHTPPREADALLAANPRAALRVVPDAGLLPHDEQPERFLELARPFLLGRPVPDIAKVGPRLLTQAVDGP